jgi:hypothetical protein
MALGKSPFEKPGAAEMSQTSFDDRLNRITEKHGLLAAGMTYRIGSDGLIRPEPVRRLTVRFPLKPLVYLVAMGFAFKLMLFVGLGEETYVARLELLQQGSTVEQIAARVMQPDAATRAVGAAFADLRMP